MATKNYLDLPGLTLYDTKIKELIAQSITPIFYDTTENWDKQTSLEAESGAIYVYLDYQKDDDDNNIPGIKIGVDNFYLIDLPFTTSLYQEHIEDTAMHVTAAEKAKWNDKVRCYIDPLNDNNLIFTTN